MAKGVKVRVLMPHVLAGAGGPAYAEGEVELSADVAEAAAALGGVEYVGKAPRRAAASKPAAGAKVTRTGNGRRKPKVSAKAKEKAGAATTEPTPDAPDEFLGKSDVAGG